jgi:hypothetical protein
LDNVLSVVREYGRYRDFYAPNVIESTLLCQTDTQDTFSLRMFEQSGGRPICARHRVPGHLYTH